MKEKQDKKMKVIIIINLKIFLNSKFLKILRKFHETFDFFKISAKRKDK